MTDVQTAHPNVEVHEPKATTRAVVVVLHGGKADSYERSEPRHLSSRRLDPFVHALHRRCRTLMARG